MGWDEKMLILMGMGMGTGMEIASVGTDGMGTNVRPHAGLYCMTGMYALFHMVVCKCYLHKRRGRNP